MNRIEALTHRIAELDARLALPLTPETRYRLQGERRELNAERSLIETQRFRGWPRLAIA